MAWREQRELVDVPLSRKRIINKTMARVRRATWLPDALWYDRHMCTLPWVKGP